MVENQPSAINPTFLEIAIPFAERGIPVIPVEPCEKRCLLPDWQRRATTSAEQIAGWNAENPNYDVGCAAKPEGIVVLDCDVKGLMRRIEQETRHKFPDTLVVRSFMTPSIAALLGRWFWWPQTVRPRPASYMLRPFGPRRLVRSLLLGEDTDAATSKLQRPVG